jgi:hypothetical protein
LSKGRVSFPKVPPIIRGARQFSKKRASFPSGEAFFLCSFPRRGNFPRERQFFNKVSCQKEEPVFEGRANYPRGEPVFEEGKFSEVKAGFPTREAVFQEMKFSKGRQFS